MGMRNAYEIRGDVTSVFVEKVSGESHEFIIDTEDLSRLISIGSSWFTFCTPNSSKYYVIRNIPKHSKSGEYRRLHRLLISAPDNLVVDHINGDSLDNRKCNLRAVTAAVNAQNLHGPRSDNNSGELNISYRKDWGSWVIRVIRDGELLNASRKSFTEAIRVRDEMRNGTYVPRRPGAPQC